MASTTSNMPRNTAQTVVGVLVLLAIALAYAGLSLVAFRAPGQLPARSMLQGAMLGPPALLVGAKSIDPLFWASTLAIVAAVAAGAALPALRLPSAGFVLLVWLCAGFLPVVMSV